MTLPITVRLFQQVDRYHYIVDNRPLIDINENLEYLLARTNGLRDDVNSLLGSTGDGSRLVRLDNDGKLSTEVLPSHSVNLLEDSTDKVLMTSAERTKLSTVKQGANMFKVRVGGQGSFLDGEIQFEGGPTLRVVQVPVANNAVKRIRFDTLFPPDKQHEHRYDRTILQLEGLVGQIPGKEEYISGTLQLFLNGIKLDITEYAEETNPVTGKRDRFRLAPGTSVNFATQRLTASYEVKPSWNNAVPDPLSITVGKPQVKHWIRNSALGADEGPSKQIEVAVPTDSGTVAADLWMINITDLNVKTPYELYQLFVNGQLVHYGADYDIITLQDDDTGVSDVWLRWRWAELDTYANEVQDWMSLTSSNFATFNLKDGWELAFYYYSDWE